MAIDFNHTIVSARDSKASAESLAEMLGLPAPRKWGPFQMVTTENGANIDFKNTEGDITASITLSWSANRSLTKSSADPANGHSRTGGIPAQEQSGKSITTMAGAASISRIPTATYWR